MRVFLIFGAWVGLNVVLQPIDTAGYFYNAIFALILIEGTRFSFLKKA